MIVGRKTCVDETILEVPGWIHRSIRDWVPRVEYRLARLLCPFGPKPWLPACIPGFAFRFLEHLRPDIVHLHWPRHGLLSIEQIGKLKSPVVWTLHDLWPLTPGYEYRIECMEDFGPFQALIPEGRLHRLATNIWKRKLRAWRNLNLSIVAPSEWMAEEARRSDVFTNRDIRLIPNTVPLEVFRPSRDRAAIRRKLGFPSDRTVLLFGADGGESPRKGGDLLVNTLRELELQVPDVCLAYFGGGNMPWLKGLNIEAFALGRICEPSLLAEIYSGADVFVCPSREDNLPNTVIESLACGTPVVGFRIGGMTDLVQDDVNGFLAAPFDTKELAHCIVRSISANRKDRRLSQTARNLAEQRYSSDRVTKQYSELYASLLAHEF